MDTSNYSELTRAILADIDRQVDIELTNTSLPRIQLVTEATEWSSPNVTQESQSVAKIANLNAIEKKIVSLLTLAGQTMDTLASENHEDSLDDTSVAYFHTNGGLRKFDDNVKQYIKLLDEIQLSLRKQYHDLATSGTASVNLPFTVSVYDTDKVLDALTRCLSLVRTEMKELSQL
ncbi:hypothetical protein IWQ62_003334 [Dispira parvispora]|uniref:Mediator of RNA polymerase II transcription subunit 11 n=1 Tax=Dispira parvispora TaxID=1520584 RepID=A0A9W8AN45_9FUNG|nr:hypothetical protein IWQ62_003334 [Dispira parvispora]